MDEKNLNKIDDGTDWSITSNGGISRSSHDEGFTFQNLLTKSDSTSKKNEEYFQLIQSRKSSGDDTYDGLEELLGPSDSEDDERLLNDQTRISFTREQLLEYQQLIKLLRLIKNAGRCTTILSLALLRDHNLQDQCAYLAFKDSSTMNILLNFIEMFDRDLKLNTLNVLKDACQNPLFAYEIFRLGGIMTIVESISFDHIGIEESCGILFKILSFHRARRVIRRCGGIGRLINLLDELTENLMDNQTNISDLFEVFVLISKSKKNKYVFIRYGIGQIFLRILSKISSKSILTLLSILLQIPIFRLQMLQIDFIITLINLLDLNNLELTRVICQSLYYLSLDSNLSQIISTNHWKKFQDLFAQTTDPSIFCSIINISAEFLGKNVNLSREFLLNILQYLRTSSDRTYLSRIYQSLNHLTKFPSMIELFQQEKIYSIFLSHLSDENLQKDILEILQQCGKHSTSARMIVENQGLQQLWTLYKLATGLDNRISAGWTIRNCLASIENHGELIRSFDGIFYLIYNTLSTENVQLLAVTLAIIAEIAKDEYNLQILTDLGVASKISQLKQLENPELRQPFCDAMSNLLNLPSNQEQFGNRRVLSILKTYLNQSDEHLNRSLTKSLFDLSLNPSNCIILHDIGLASDLLRLIGNEHNQVQENAANALRNLRKLSEANRQIERN